MGKVSILKSDIKPDMKPVFRADEIRKVVEKSIKSTWLKQVHTSDKVFIKVNICIDRPTRGATVTPEVIGSLVEILRDRASEVVVGESDASSTSGDLAFQTSGIGKAVDDAGGKWINISKDETVVVNDRKLQALNGKKFSKTMMDADIVVSNALVKTHEITEITSTIKNMFGSLPYKKKLLFHPKLDQVMNDLVYVYQPVALVDGLVAMEGNGPAQGDLVDYGVMLSGDNCVETDATVATIMGFDPEQIRHIRLGHTRGIGDIFNIEYPDMKPEQVYRKFRPAGKDIVLVSELALLRYWPTRALFFQTPIFELLRWMANVYRDRTRKKKGLAFE